MNSYHILFYFILFPLAIIPKNEEAEARKKNGTIHSMSINILLMHRYKTLTYRQSKLSTTRFQFHTTLLHVFERLRYAIIYDDASRSKHMPSGYWKLFNSFIDFVLLFIFFSIHHHVPCLLSETYL